MFSGVEWGPSAILGHRNVRYSAICSSNCSARGIFYISCIEAQQLQLAWHVVGVFKGGVATKRVSESNLPLRATHTREHLHINTHKMHTGLHPHVHNHTVCFCLRVKINDVNDIPKHRGKFCASKFCFPLCCHSAALPWSHWFRESAGLKGEKKKKHTHTHTAQASHSSSQLAIIIPC